MKITVKIKNQYGERQIYTEPGTRLSDLLLQEGEHLDMPCAGKGTCKKCRVKVLGEITPPSIDEKEALGSAYAQGWRLACSTYVQGDSCVWMDSTQDFDTAVINGMIQTTAFEPQYHQYGMAVDIGTTTIAAKLCENGKVIAEATAKNPQTAFGGDVISRIGVALEDEEKRTRLAAAVQTTIAELARRMCHQDSPSQKIDAVCITGNTAMLYLLSGKNPQSLSAAPFDADWLFGGQYDELAEKLGIDHKGKVFLAPCISAFVGGDITTAILASDLTETKDTAFLVDVGTNGEMALWHNQKLLCCSTAAGPAFEGADIIQGMHGVAGAIDHVYIKEGEISCSVIGGKQPKGICGSGLVDAAAVMLEAGVLDENGNIEKTGHKFTHRVQEVQGDLFFELKDGIGLYGRDIRALQLAKSAVSAGIETLLDTAGLCADAINTVWIAGGFGSYLNTENAVKIGLLPKGFRNIASIGNAALSGAVMLLNNAALILHAQEIAGKADTINLSANPVFMEKYIEGMTF